MRICSRLLGPALSCTLLLALLLPGCPPANVPTSQPPLSQTRVGVSAVAGGFTSPIAMAVPDDGTGRLFIADQVGKIFIIDAAGNRLQAPFLDITDRVLPFAGDERGLLGLAFHPQYAQNGRFFVVYNAPLGPSDPQQFNCLWRLSEFHVSTGDANQADPAGEAVLQAVLKPQSNHNGGQLAFGPDGMLYASLGDGGSGGDIGFGHTPALGNAQDLTVLLGKLLRFNADTPGALAIPPDNPFISDASVLPAIFAYGLRNPWRFSFDQGGTHRLFCGDVGQNLFEEVDIIHAGDNLGWHIKEGSHCFDPAAPNTPPATCPSAGANGRPLIDPILEYSHFNDAGPTVRTAIIGGYVYRGTNVPDLAGRYVFGDYTNPANPPGGAIFLAEEDAAGNWQFAQLPIATSSDNRIDRHVLAFGQDLQGEVYILTAPADSSVSTTGEVVKIVPAP
jgi:glucose/arabinose dehydrogenase